MLNIDKTKLSRDYKANPIKRGELIPKCDVIEIYLNQNIDLLRTCEFFGISRMVLRRSLKTYGLKKSPEKYRQNAQETCLKRFGAKTPLESKVIYNKTVDTVKNKYGVANPFQADFVKEKAKQTLINKYGVENIQKLPQIQKKTQHTMQERYGVKCGMQVRVKNPEIWYNDSALEDFIKNGNSGQKWSTYELMSYFNLSDSPVQERIGNLNLWGYINQCTSSSEKEITQLLIDLGETVTKFKTKDFEIDIYIQNKKFGIEFNGNYWHSTRVRKDYKYHLKKSEKAAELGIFVYHVFEYEWLYKKERVISQIKNLLGLNTETIYARKCAIKNISPKDEHDFLDKNHIQGDANAKVRLGLFYKDNLVSVMTFGKSRFNKHIEWELVRFCNKRDTTVIGGASKLFKHFVKTYNPNTIISYSDIAKTKGTLYGILGFKTVGRAEPNYVWVNHNTVMSRYQTQKHILIKQGFGNLGNTEKEIMEARNFAQVYDCGTRVHVWRKTNGN